MSENTDFEESITLTITPEDVQAFKRFDHFLAKRLPDWSRSFLKNLFKEGLINFEDQNKKEKLELKKMPTAGSKVVVQIPPPLPSTAEPENIPIEILFEDEHLVIVNKPAGMVTHPAPGNYTGTLVNAILHHCPDIQRIGDTKRPGIVHRLDKGTSGVMVVAKNMKCHEGLVLLFSKHSIERVYEALAMGTKMAKGGKIESLIGRHPRHRLKMSTQVRTGKESITYYNVINYYHKFSHLKLKLETGRTHQIRVHLTEHLLAPILNDSLYGNPKEHAKRLGTDYEKLLKDYEHPFLHAKVLGFVHPITKEQLRFEVNPPKIFQEVLTLAQKEI